MNTKNQSKSTAVLALFLTSMFVFALVPIGLSYGDDDHDVMIHVGQDYTYEPIFNIKDVSIIAVVADDNVLDLLNDGAPSGGSSGGTVSFEGKAVGNTTVTITGTSPQISTNTSEQVIKVKVIAALEITTTELTFYKDVAGSEGQIKPDDNPDIEYSAQNLPTGLHMDASGSGLIYGKATATGTTEIVVTATNTKTTWTVTKSIYIIVVDNGSDFSLVADEKVAEVSGDARYFVLSSDDTFSFEIDTADIDGTWSVIASGAFAAAVECSVDDTNEKLIFTPTGADFTALSGDYVVYIGHNVNGTITAKYIVIHFQTDLEFNTKPIASFVVGYQTNLVEVGVPAGP